LPFIPPLSWRGASCVSPICRTTRSTASADMKQPFGARPARFCLHSMFWAAANHGIGGTVSLPADGKNCGLTIRTNVDFDDTIIADQVVARIRNWVRFVDLLPSIARSPIARLRYGGGRVTSMQHIAKIVTLSRSLSPFGSVDARHWWHVLAVKDAIIRAPKPRAHRPTASASASTRLCSTSSTVSPSAKRRIVRSKSCRQIWILDQGL
jgi:hypothetical protein